MYLAVFIVVVFGLTLAGVEVFRRWSLRREILDIPNERSSHSIPTPRGGGVIIVLVAGIACLLLSYSRHGFGQWRFFAGGAVIAAISLADDIRSVPPLVRIIFHSAAALLAVSGAFPAAFSGQDPASTVSAGLAFVWIVWLVNAYNFMDGIDGLAALQAIVGGTAWAFAAFAFGAAPDLLYGGAAIAASAAGFLMLNWHPARIFMGDVGSAFLGYSFAVIPLVAIEGSRGSPTWPVIAFAVAAVWFVVFDSALTVVRRAGRGEAVWLPHRDHIYQVMIRSGRSHADVASFYGALALMLAGTSAGAVTYGGTWVVAACVTCVCGTFALLFRWLRAAREDKGI